MHTFDVYCNEKQGYWRVLANDESEAIYEATKGNDTYTGIYTIQRY